MTNPKPTKTEEPQGCRHQVTSAVNPISWLCPRKRLLIEILDRHRKQWANPSRAAVLV